MGESLNEQQLEIVENIDGSFLVLAPAGCGKTKSISMRIENMIQKGIRPSEILCLTFTNRASREMLNRIKSQNRGASKDITIKTFHGFCYQICRHEHKNLDIIHDFTIYDEDDTKEIIREILAEMGMNHYDYILNRIYNFLQKIKEEKLVDENAKCDGIFQGIIDEYKGDDIPKEFNAENLLEKYEAVLEKNSAMDFSDLSIKVTNLFRDEKILDSWRRKYKYVIVDEVQDTNILEYDIISSLAVKHKNLAFFGDFDQTIYEWRGSKPQAIIDRFKSGFHPVKEINLTRNYRSTAQILNASREFIGAYENAKTKELIPVSKEEGDPIFIHVEENPDREYAWICREIERIVREDGIKLKEMAILTRNNRLNVNISNVMKRMKIPAMLVDEFKFFRRKEIKDIMSYLRFLINPFDESSFNRMIKSVPNRIGEATMKSIRAQINGTGLALCDFLNSQLEMNPDPFEPLLTAYENDSVVVFDVESTGLDILTDEVVEIAAIKFGKSGKIQEFHHILKNDKDLGESTFVHGYDQDYIDRNGHEPKGVFESFKRFIDGSIVIGHNVQYDIGIMESQAKRLGISMYQMPTSYDTLDMARRFYPGLEKYKLGYLAEYLKLDHTPTHNAMDDIIATMMLFEKMAGEMYLSKMSRMAVYNEYTYKFKELRRKIEKWKKNMDMMRPHDLMAEILKDSSMIRYYEKKNEINRLNNLRELYAIVRYFDNESLTCRDAIVDILSNISLGSDMERYIKLYNKIPIITVHQAKGLEFKVVFMPSLNEGDFPSFMSIKHNNCEEEHRLFYVAMTRAKEKIYMSYNLRDKRDKLKQKSKFIDYIPREYTKYI